MPDFAISHAETSLILDSLAARMTTFAKVAAVHLHPDTWEAIRTHRPHAVSELSGAHYVLGVPAVLVPFVPISTPLIVEGPDAPPAPFGPMIRESELDKLQRILRDYGRLCVESPEALRYTVRLTPDAPCRYLRDVFYALPSTDITCVSEYSAATDDPVMTFTVTGDTARAWFAELPDAHTTKKEE